MNVAGALLKRVLPEPIHDIDDAVVFRIGVLPQRVDIHQLLKIGAAGGGALRVLDRFGDQEKLVLVAFNIEGVGQYNGNGALQVLLKHFDPRGVMVDIAHRDLDMAFR